MFGNKPSSFIVVISLVDWLEGLAENQRYAIEFVYHEVDSLLYNLGMSIVEAINQTSKENDSTIRSRVQYFVEEEQEYLLNVLEDGFRDKDGDNDADIEDMRHLIMLAINEFHDLYVENIFGQIRDTFNRNLIFDESNYEFEYKRLPRDTIGFVIKRKEE